MSGEVCLVHGTKMTIGHKIKHGFSKFKHKVADVAHEMKDVINKAVDHFITVSKEICHETWDKALDFLFTILNKQINEKFGQDEIAIGIINEFKEKIDEIGEDIINDTHGGLDQYIEEKLDSLGENKALVHQEL